MFMKCCGYTVVNGGHCSDQQSNIKDIALNTCTIILCLFPPVTVIHNLICRIWPMSIRHILINGYILKNNLYSFSFTTQGGAFKQKVLHLGLLVTACKLIILHSIGLGVI